MLQTFRDHQLYAKFSKCEFWLPNMTFFRYVVSKESINVDPKKVEMVQNWPKSIIVMEICSFLGLAKYYRCFMKYFSHISTPLIKLKQKNVKFVWFRQCEESF